MGKALRCSSDVPTDQHFACRVLPLPVVLFPEMPLRGRDGDKDGGMQLLPDNAVVCTSWPGTPSLFGCLQTRHWLPPEKVSGQLLDTRGHCAFQGGFPPPWLLWAQRRGFCSASPGILLWAGPPHEGGGNFTPVSGPTWPARPMGRALVWESGDHVSKFG